MARQIIFLSTHLDTDGNMIGQAALWLTTPATLLPLVTNTALESQVPDATAAELLALQNGTITEVVITRRIPTGATTAQIETTLQTALTTAQSTLNAQAPAKRYAGMYFDSVTGWTNVPA